MTARCEQAATVIRDAVQLILTRGLNDPRVRGLISITRVDVSPDLATAVINVSVLPQEHAKTTLSGLTSAASHIRRLVAREVKFRRLPQLVFRLDDSLKRQARVLAAINQALERDLGGSVSPSGNGSEETES